MAEIRRKMWISNVTSYRWKKKFTGLEGQKTIFMDRVMPTHLRSNFVNALSCGYVVLLFGSLLEKSNDS